MPVVRCGEADAEENENAVYTAGSWPASASAQVTALQLRFQPSDVGVTASATGSSSSSTSTSGSTGSGNETSGLSTGVKAAIGTTIPLVFILGALAAFLLWRRRKHRSAAKLSRDLGDGHETKQSYEEVPQQTYMDNKGMSAAAVPGVPKHDHHETPEWNAELDATEAERRRYMAVQGSLFPPVNGGQAASPGGASEASELGGMMRVGRKPVAPVELDSMPVTMELASDGRPV